MNSFAENYFTEDLEEYKDFSYRKKLRDIGNSLREELGCDVIVMNLFDPYIYDFEVPLTIGKLRYKLQKPINHKTIIWKLIDKDFRYYFAKDSKSDEQIKDSKFIYREEIVSTAIIKLEFHGLFYGWVFLNYKKIKNIGFFEERRIIKLISNLAEKIHSFFPHNYIGKIFRHHNNYKMALLFEFSNKDFELCYPGSYFREGTINSITKFQAKDVFVIDEFHSIDINNIKVQGEFLQREGIVNHFVIPLRYHEINVGYLFLGGDENSSDVPLNNDLINFISSNFCFFRQNRINEQTITQQGAFQEFVRDVIVENNSFDVTLNKILKYIIALTGAQFGTLHLVQGSNQVVRAVAPDEYNQYLGITRSLANDNGFTTLAINSGKDQLIKDITDPAVSNIYFKINLNTRSEIVIVLFDGNKKIGVINIEFEEPDAFGKDHVQIIRSAANNIQLLIVNTKRNEALKDITRITLEMQKIIGDVKDLAPWKRMIEGIVSVTSADCGSILLFDENTALLGDVVNFGYPEIHIARKHKIGDDSVIGTVAKLKQTKNIPDVRKEEKYYRAIPSTISELTVPIIGIDDSLYGIINLESDKQNAFNLDDEELVKLLANNILSALNNSKMYVTCESEKDRQNLLYSSARLITENNAEFEYILEKLTKEATIASSSKFGILYLIKGNNLIISNGYPVDYYENVPSELFNISMYGQNLIADSFSNTKLVTGNMEWGSYGNYNVGVVPIYSKQILNGKLVLAKPNDSKWTEECKKISWAMANLIASAVENEYYKDKWETVVNQVTNRSIDSLNSISHDLLDIRKGINIRDKKMLERILIFIENEIDYQESIASEQIYLREPTLVLEEVKLRDVILNAKRINENYALSQGVKIQIKIPEKDFYCRSDKKTLEFVFKNLIQNAIRFSESLKNDSKVVEIFGENNDGVIKISIRNYGKGLDTGSLERIFTYEEFHTMAIDQDKKIYIGLDDVKRSLKVIGCAIGATSQEGFLTNITVIIPPMPDFT